MEERNRSNNNNTSNKISSVKKIVVKKSEKTNIEKSQKVDKSQKLETSRSILIYSYSEAIENNNNCNNEESDDEFIVDVDTRKKRPISRPVEVSTRDTKEIREYRNRQEHQIKDEFNALGLASLTLNYGTGSTRKVVLSISPKREKFYTLKDLERANEILCIIEEGTYEVNEKLLKTEFQDLASKAKKSELEYNKKVFATIKAEERKAGMTKEILNKKIDEALTKEEIIIKYRLANQQLQEKIQELENKEHESVKELEEVAIQLDSQNEKLLKKVKRLETEIEYLKLKPTKTTSESEVDEHKKKLEREKKQRYRLKKRMHELKLDSE